MKLVALIVVPFVVYVAILNACSNIGSIRKWGRFAYSTVEEEVVQDDSEIDYCKSGKKGILRQIHDHPVHFHNILEDELQDVILTLWELDKNERADGQYKTDWDYRVENGIGQDGPVTRKLFSTTDINLCEVGACKALWEVFEAYDSGNVAVTDEAIGRFFNKTALSPSYRYVKDYLKSKKHPVAQNPGDFDQSVSHIWTRKFRRKYIGIERGGCTGFSHYFIGDKYAIDVGRLERAGFHDWLRLIYLQSKDRLVFKGYTKYNQTSRILSIIFDTIETQSGHREVLTRTSGSSVIFGTSPSFSIALMTLLYYTRDRQCVKFCLGDRTAVQVSPRSVSGKKKNSRKYMGGIFATATDENCRIRDRINKLKSNMIQS